MVDLLRDLRDNHGVVEVKAEFETEATRMNELMRLKAVAERAGLGLVLKVGGAEAVTDMYDGKTIGITGLIAPMIETPYAMRKYLEAIRKNFSSDLRNSIHFGANIETITGYQNLKDMFSLEDIDLIDTITLGRVDMTGSLGLGRGEINSDRVYEIAEGMFSQAKKKGYRTTLGGGISTEAIPFIKKLAVKKLLDRFETRKIVFTTPKGLVNIEKAIVKANQFELLWLENKRNYYLDIFIEDKDRIAMLMRRV